MPFPIAAAAPIIASGVSALSSIFTNWRNQKLANEQNQFNLNMWKAQNQYNTPAEQLARFKQAGINPNFMGSSISAGNVAASATPSADLANQVSPFTPEAGAQVASAIIEGKNAETNAKNAETEAKNAETNAQNAETNRLRQEVDARLANLEGEVKKEQKEFIYQQRLNAEQELNNIVDMGEKIREETKGHQQMNRNLKVVADLAEKYGEAQVIKQLDEATSRIKLNISQAELNDVNKELAPKLAEYARKTAEAACTSADAAKLNADTAKRRLDFEVGEAFQQRKNVDAATIEMYKAIAWNQYAGILRNILGGLPKAKDNFSKMFDKNKPQETPFVDLSGYGSQSNPNVYGSPQLPSNTRGLPDNSRYLPWLGSGGGR